MKPKATHSTLCKCVAFVLCVCFAFAGLLCAAAAVYLYEDSYYNGERRFYEQSSLFLHASSDYADAAYRLYFYGTLRPDEGLSTEYYERLLDPASTNYRYAVYNEACQRVAGTADNLPDTLESPYWYGSNGRYSSGGDNTWYEIVGTLDPDMPANDAFSEQARLFNALLAMKYWIIALGALALLLSLALFIFLLCAAGRYADAEQPECRHLDRAPFDLYLAVCIGLCVGAGYIVASFGSLLQLVLAFILIVVVLVLLVALFMSFAARVKCRNLFHNTVIGWCLRQLWRFVRWCCRGIRALYVNLPVLWKALLTLCAFLLLDAILIASGARSGGLAGLLCVLMNIAAVAFVCAAVLQMKRLQAGAKALESGDFTRQLDTKGLYSEFKRHAETLNGIGAGMGRAVEARMKSERMKTDLITNVSHDLKTPLTSIVNYVDLLKKEALEPPADEYVAVLERQAQRLKKLSEDVVEASKASSGVLNVNLQPTDLGELVNQSMAEYAARFAEGGLAPVVTLPETPLIARADGRLLWRALDNLLSNAAKYALPGTRVYIAAAADGGTARLSVKNVSREPLNIDPAELTERFVRGDASRSAEGSGLGLSIAQSLVALQSGTLALSIDGDLFKAEIVLPSL